MGHGGNKTQRIDITDSYDPRIVGRAAQKGTLFRFIPASGDPELLIKKDDGFSTEWESVGGANSLPVTVARVRDANANVDISSAPADIDGVTLDVDDIVLLTNQTAPEENGVYTFNGAGIAMTRATGWSASVDFVPGRQVYVDQGNTNAEQLWANANYVPNLETDPVTFINVSASAGMATDFSNAQPAANSIDMQNNEINNVGGPTLNGDAANKVYVDNLVGAKMNQDFSDAQPAANAIDLNNNLINNVLDPVSDQDAATKKYVDDNATPPPTGTPNTIPVFDNVGTLVSDSSIRLNPSLNGSLMIGDQGNGTINAAGSGSLAYGFVPNRGSILAAGEGAFALGYVVLNAIDTPPTIQANANGSMAMGYAHDPAANIYTDATAYGSLVFGYAFTSTQIGMMGAQGALLHGTGIGGTMYGVGHGSHTHGYSTGSGLLRTSGLAAHTHGQVSGSTSIIDATGTGATAFGVAVAGAPDAASIIASGNGALAYGYASGISTMLASGHGSHAGGSADTGGEITASGEGAFARGRSINGGQILATGTGSFCSGYSDNDSSETLSLGSFSHGRRMDIYAEYAVGMGQGIENGSYCAMIVGMFNSNPGGTTNAFVATDAAFIVGNGVSNAARSNAFRIDKDGRVQETGANVIPVRMIVANGTLSARTDRKLILNNFGGGASTVTLPAGVDGLTFKTAPTDANTATWSFVPDGGDTVDAAVPADLGSGPVEITFFSGVWYLI